MIERVRKTYPNVSVFANTCGRYRTPIPPVGLHNAA